MIIVAARRYSCRVDDVNIDGFLLLLSCDEQNQPDIGND